MKFAVTLAVQRLFSILASLFGFALAVASLPSVAASAAAPLLERPQSALGAPAKLPAGHSVVRFNREQALQLHSGQEMSLGLPNGKAYTVVFDRLLHHDSGSVTWIGHLKGFGDDYRVVITTGSDASLHGSIATPGGRFLLRGHNGEAVLTDTKAAGMAVPLPHRGDAKPPARRLRRDSAADTAVTGSSTGGAPAAAPAQAEGSSVVDLMVLYTPEMLTRYGSDAAVRSRIDYLTAMANQAYIDSGIAISLRLVYAAKVGFSAAIDLDTALDAISASDNPADGLASDPAFANVATLRRTYGADVVTLLRPFDTRVDPDTCGLGWIGGYLGTNIANDATWAYSVVNDGDDSSGTPYYCPDTTMVHEIGHNMGAAHDPAHASGMGAYSYAYGHGVWGVFGTVMSYIDPGIAKFSNPAVTCNGRPCGISGLRDNARALNNTRATVAAFMPTVVASGAQAIKPQSGWWWNPAESGRGFSIEVSNNTLFMAAYLYDSSGRAAWYISAGALSSDGSYSGQLQEYTGGQSLTGTYRSPTVLGNVSPVSLTCSTTTACTLTWLGGTVAIQRYIWDSSGAAAGAPETGWWWNAAESGRGFFLEQQGNVLFLSGYMYDNTGKDVWYISAGQRNGSTYLNTWSEYANGQTLTGSYRAPTVASANVGDLTLQFVDSANAQLTLPDGRTIPLTRYRF